VQEGLLTDEEEIIGYADDREKFSICHFSFFISHFPFFLQI